MASQVNNLSFGTQGSILLKSLEGLQLIGYLDSGGITTNGWGHTGKDVKEGVTITINQAINNLTSDISPVVKAVNTLVTVPLAQNQFDALVIFVYNIGIGAFTTSTLLKLLNQKQYTEVPTQLIRWDKCKGSVVQGLINRRNAEIKLWNTK